MEEPDPIEPIGTVGDQVLYRDGWGTIAKRADGTYWAAGHKNGVRVFALESTWAAIRSKYVKHRGRAARKARRLFGLCI